MILAAKAAEMMETDGDNASKEKGGARVERKRLAADVGGHGLVSRDS